MKARLASLLVLIALLCGGVVMPAIAHASDPHTTLTFDASTASEADAAEHQHPGGDDSDMPCHGVSHHHCSVALHLDGPRIDLNSVAKRSLLRPATTTPLVSHSQAPPLDPPLA